MGRAITEQAISLALERAERGGERVELIDEAEKGLRLRIGERGAKWSYLTRLGEAERLRVPLGSWPSVSVPEARAAAQSLKRQLNLHRPEPRTSLRVGELLELYDRRRLVQLKRGAGTLRSLEAVLSSVLERDVLTLTRRDIALLIDEKADVAPVHANRTLAYLKALFTWAVGRGYLENNPAAMMAKPTREVARSRAPDLGELVEIWLACDCLGYPFGPAIQLMMLTAARRDEAAALRTSELKLAAGEMVWTLPGERSKNGRAIRTGLSQEARAVIEAALASRSEQSDWVFTTTGRGPISGWSKAKRRLDDLVARARRARSPDAGDMPAWRLHDLRRSFATLACDTLQIDPAVADRCLNHVGASTTSTIARVYGRNEMFEQRKEALARWADLLADAVEHGPASRSSEVNPASPLLHL